MKKYIDKINKPTVLLISCFSVLVVLLVATIYIKTNNKISLSEGVSTIYTSAREYNPTSIANLYVEENTNKEENKEQVSEEVTETKENIVEEQPKIEEKKEEVVVQRNEVYEGMTIEELTDKLNRSLNSNVAGYGNLFATYSLEKGVDPYISVAIMLHETGCKWNCSALVKNSNNVGGQKSSNGSYRKFDTLEDGIRGYIDNLSANYFALGLNTTESIARKYTGHSGGEWVTKVNSYIEQIRAN